MKLTWKHFKRVFLGQKREHVATSKDNYFSKENSDGMFTLQYPKESFPVPDNGRYRLHNEIEDCIVCDKCAKICPVDCIDIVPVRSPTEIRKASDGSSVKMYASTFDIDMAKCCYCGLCTTVCPTECLTMTKTYDYSEFDVRDMVYEFSDLTPEEAKEKQVLFDDYQAKKKAAAATKATKPAGAKPAMPAIKKPMIKPAKPKTDEDS